MYSTVFVAGYGNSEPQHWQKLWFEKTQNSHWVEQDNWDKPTRDLWIEALNETLLHVKGPVLIVAHSMGCHTVVEWVKEYYTNQNIIGALLVAPPDTQRINFPKEIVGYENPPMQELPFKSIAVLSSNHPYASLDRAHELISSWGSESVEVGALGHINLASHLGYWEEGREILAKLVSSTSKFMGVV